MPVGSVYPFFSRFEYTREGMLYRVRNSVNESKWVGTLDPLVLTRCFVADGVGSSGSEPSSSSLSSTFIFLSSLLSGFAASAFRFFPPLCAYLKKSNSAGSDPSVGCKTSFSGLALGFVFCAANQLKEPIAEQAQPTLKSLTSLLNLCLSNLTPPRDNRWNASMTTRMSF